MVISPLVQGRQIFHKASLGVFGHNMESVVHGHWGSPSLSGPAQCGSVVHSTSHYVVVTNLETTGSAVKIFQSASGLVSTFSSMLLKA